MSIPTNSCSTGILLLALLATPGFADSWVLTSELADDAYSSQNQVQATNLIQMDNLTDFSSEITQSATPSADVRLQQDSSHPLQAVNALITGDSAGDISVTQTFNADTVGVEMIQNGASHALQAINYIGTR